jgi:membrane protein YdbS with pleckstrin-like domain
MLLILAIIVVLLVWFFGRLDLWGFEARPILVVFCVLVLLVQLLFRTRIRYR